MNRVLITGATGFVGSHIAAAFEQAGYAVRCTVRATSDTGWLSATGVETVEVDLAENSALEVALSGVRSVVHCAGITRAANPELYRTVNVEATERLAVAASEAGVDRFVFVSSLAARGPDGSVGPTSAYGQSKKEAEERLGRLRSGMRVAVLRPAGVYGPRDRDMLPLFRMARRGWLVAPAGDAPLQPVYVTDVARAALLAARGGADGRAVFGPYPVAESRRYAWSEVRTALADAFDREVRLLRLPRLGYEVGGWVGEAVGRITGRPPAFDLRRARDLARYTWTCDSSVTREALGWSASVSLSEGLERALRWYRESGWLRA